LIVRRRRTLRRHSCCGNGQRIFTHKEIQNGQIVNRQIMKDRCVVPRLPIVGTNRLITKHARELLSGKHLLDQPDAAAVEIGVVDEQDAPASLRQ
jgi:hypothetical protein